MTDSFDDETGRQMVSDDIWKGRLAFYEAIVDALTEASPELLYDMHRALPDQGGRLAQLLRERYETLSNPNSDYRSTECGSLLLRLRTIGSRSKGQARLR